MGFNKHYRRYNNQMKFLVGNVKKKQIPFVRRELEIIRVRMFDKMDGLFRYSTGALASVQNFPITGPRKGANAFVMDLRCVSPYAQVQEFGVTEMWVDASKYPKLMNWATVVGYNPSYTKAGAAWVHIGGSDSRIKKGNSQNRFFFDTIREYFNSKRLSKEISKATHQGALITFGGK